MGKYKNPIPIVEDEREIEAVKDNAELEQLMKRFNEVQEEANLLCREILKELKQMKRG